MMGVFADLEQFVAAHRPCGGLTSDVGGLASEGYLVRVSCSCGTFFERWVTAESADRDLLRSRLPALPN